MCNKSEINLHDLVFVNHEKALLIWERYDLLKPAQQWHVQRSAWESIEINHNDLSTLRPVQSNYLESNQLVFFIMEYRGLNKV